MTHGEDTAPTVVDEFGDTDTLTNIERIRVEGGEAGDTLTGSVLDDELLGGAGDDTLNGGAGDDTLEGGAGMDDLNGGDGFDSAFYALVNTDSGITFDASGVNADGEIIVSNDGFGTEDILSGIENIFAAGSDFDDSLTGSQVADDLLGRAGNDTLTGGSGADTLIGGAGADTFVFADGDTTLADGGDIIEDFEDGQDLIDLGAVTTDGSTPIAFADLSVQAVDTNGDNNNDALEIAYTDNLGNAVITLSGLNDPSAIDSADFIFA